MNQHIDLSFHDTHTLSYFYSETSKPSLRNKTHTLHLGRLTELSLAIRIICIFFKISNRLVFSPIIFSMCFGRPSDPLRRLHDYLLDNITNITHNPHQSCEAAHLQKITCDNNKTLRVQRSLPFWTSTDAPRPAGLPALPPAVCSTLHRCVRLKSPEQFPIVQGIFLKKKQ